LPAGLRLAASGSSAIISGTPTTVGNYSYTVRVTDSNAPAQTATQTVTGTVIELVPSITVQPGSLPTQPVSVGLQLSTPAPVPLQVTLSLSFLPTVAGLPAGYIDPALQFLAGGRTMTFTMPAGTTSVIPQNAAIQPGTVAGNITVSLVRLVVGTNEVTPLTSFQRSFPLPVLPPVITANSVRITSVTGSGFNVELTGYSTPRDLSTATFTFAVTSGTQIDGSATLSVDVRNAFVQWYGSTPSLGFGSVFRLQVPFTIQGDPNLIQSVSVTLANSQGTSIPVSGGRQ
jgi:hypothetical protein